MSKETIPLQKKQKTSSSEFQERNIDWDVANAPSQNSFQAIYLKPRQTEDDKRGPSKISDILTAQQEHPTLPT